MSLVLANTEVVFVDRLRFGRFRYECNSQSVGFSVNGSYRGLAELHIAHSKEWVI